MRSRRAPWYFRGEVKDHGRGRSAPLTWLTRGDRHGYTRIGRMLVAKHRAALPLAGVRPRVATGGPRGRYGPTARHSHTVLPSHRPPRLDAFKARRTAPKPDSPGHPALIERPPSCHPPPPASSHPSPGLDGPTVLVGVEGGDGHVGRILALPLHGPAVRAARPAGVWIGGPAPPPPRSSHPVAPVASPAVLSTPASSVFRPACTSREQDRAGAGTRAGATEASERADRGSLGVTTGRSSNGCLRRQAGASAPEAAARSSRAGKANRSSGFLVPRGRGCPMREGEDTKEGVGDGGGGGTCHCSSRVESYHRRTAPCTF